MDHVGSLTTEKNVGDDNEDGEELIVIPGGQPNMQQLLQQAQKMQQDLARAQEELANTEVDGQAGGGLVKATVTGAGELRALKIDPKAVDPEDTETLADLIVAAVQAANQNAQTLQQQKLGPLAQGLGGGSGIPGLPF
ncbi:Nucleoid-associated protein [Streptomyces sp. enrichment culture]